MTTDSNIPKKLLRQRTLLFGMILLLAILALILIWPFITPILFAIAVVVIMKPVYNWLLRKKWVKGRETWANGITMIIFILAIALPFVLIIGSAISQANQAFEGLQDAGLDMTVEGIAAWVQDTFQETGGEEATVDEAEIAATLQQAADAVLAWVQNTIINLGQTIPEFFTNAVIVLVLLFVMLPLYKRPGRKAVVDIVPFPPEITQLFLDKGDMMITAMFKGTFVIAIVSGAAMGIVLWIAGVPYATLLAIISAFLSLIPMVGISLVAWPVGILLILAGNTWQGIFVIVAFLLVVANIDNVMRPMLVPKGAHLNPALVILSVLGGISLMGLIGVIYGPVIMILLVTSIEVYTKYMLRSDLEALQEHGRIDLEALGLTQEEDEEERSVGNMIVTALQNASAQIREDTSSSEDDAQPDLNQDGSTISTN
jgi:predicted PurR-regulated permease PerM